MLTTILCRCGTAMGLSRLNSFISTGATSLRKRSFRRGVSFALWRATTGARCSSCCAPPFFSLFSLAIFSLQLLAFFIQRGSAFLAHPDLAVSLHSMADAHRTATRTYQLHLRN